MPLGMACNAFRSSSFLSFVQCDVHCDVQGDVDGQAAPDLAAVAQRLGLHQQIASVPDESSLEHMNSCWPVCLPRLDPSSLTVPEDSLSSQMFNHG